MGFAGRVPTLIPKAAIAEVEFQVDPNTGATLVRISDHHFNSIALSHDEKLVGPRGPFADPSFDNARQQANDILDY